MKQTRKLTAMLMCIVMLFTSCRSTGNTSAENVESDLAEVNEPVTLLVWESADGPDKWIKQAAESFNKKYPYITVEFENVELTDNIETLKNRSENGTAADLFAAPHDEVGRIASEALALPVKNASSISSKVLGVCSSALSSDGVLYGYPTSAETYAMYYNKSLLSEADIPTSWQDLYEFAEKFNGSNKGKYALVFDTTTAYYTNLFATRNNNRLFGRDGNDTSSLYTDIDEAIKGYSFFGSLRNVFDMPSTEITGDCIDELFTTGQAAMCISGPWSIAKYTNAGIDFGVTVLPSLEGEDTPALSFSGIRGMFVSAYTKHPEEAAMFAEYLTTQEMQKLRYEITGALPSVDLAIDNEVTLAFIRQLEYSCPMPSVPQMSTFWASAIEASKAIWDGADADMEIRKLETTVIGE